MEVNIIYYICDLIVCSLSYTVTYWLLLAHADPWSLWYLFHSDVCGIGSVSCRCLCDWFGLKVDGWQGRWRKLNWYWKCLMILLVLMIICSCKKKKWEKYKKCDISSVCSWPLPCRVSLLGRSTHPNKITYDFCVLEGRWYGVCFARLSLLLVCVSSPSLCAISLYIYLALYSNIFHQKWISRRLTRVARS